MRQRRGEIDELHADGACFAIAGGVCQVGWARLVTLIGLVLACAAGLAVAAQVAEACPNEAARIDASAGLPDCRAYELVTPVDKSSAVQDIDPTSSFGVPAVDGNRLALKTLVALGPRPMPNGSFSIFSRTSSGWQPESVPPPGSGSAFYEEPIFNPDLTEIGVGSYTTTPVSLQETYQIGPPGELDVPVATTPTNYHRPAGEVDFLAGASADFSRVFFESTDHTLLSGTPTGTVPGALDLYEWAGGSLQRLVNVESGGAPVSPCGAEFDAASQGGSTVVFTSPYNKNNELTDPSCQQPAQLYMRVNGSSTVDVSKPNTGVVDPSGFHPVQFQGASADGSKVFFTTETELTGDDEGIHDAELYEYDASAPEGERLTRVSRGIINTGPAEGEVQTEYVLVPENASEVYFYALGKLTPDAQDLKSAADIDNIYRYDTTTHDIRYIATAKGPPDAPSVLGSLPRPSSPSDDQVTPSGRFFLFVSKGILGSSVNDPAEYGEIYRYDNETSSLTCVSCAPSPAPARGGAILVHDGLTAWDEIPRVTTVSEDGSYVFFESNDQLVSKDVNGPPSNTPGNQPWDDPKPKKQDPWTDVYEWHEGVVSLISSGNDAQEAVLIGASANGSDVFFETHSQLVPQDQDTSTDIYDARIGGGFPAPTESAACLGDTCLSPPAASIEPTLGTSAPSGFGNIASVLTVVKSKAPPKGKGKGCGKGKVRRKSRCIKKRKARKSAARKSARRVVKLNRGGSK